MKKIFCVKHFLLSLFLVGAFALVSCSGDGPTGDPEQDGHAYIQVCLKGDKEAVKKFQQGIDKLYTTPEDKTKFFKGWMDELESMSEEDKRKAVEGMMP